jgi:hypothetical protein
MEITLAFHQLLSVAQIKERLIFIVVRSSLAITHGLCESRIFSTYKVNAKKRGLSKPVVQSISGH